MMTATSYGGGSSNRNKYFSNQLSALDHGRHMLAVRFSSYHFLGPITLKDEWELDRQMHKRRKGR
jgi:hypothetical protein